MGSRETGRQKSTFPGANDRDDRRSQRTQILGKHSKQSPSGTLRTLAPTHYALLRITVTERAIWLHRRKERQALPLQLPFPSTLVSKKSSPRPANQQCPVPSPLSGLKGNQIARQCLLPLPVVPGSSSLSGTVALHHGGSGTERAGPGL